MNEQGSSQSNANGNSGGEERKFQSLPRLNRGMREQVGSHPYGDLLGRLQGIIGENNQASQQSSAADQQRDRDPRLNGLRARSTTLRLGNGNVMSVINIGVPAEHPLADRTSMAGPSGLHNVQVGGMQMPAPQFVVMHRSQDAPGQGE